MFDDSLTKDFVILGVIHHYGYLSSQQILNIGTELGCLRTIQRHTKKLSDMGYLRTMGGSRAGSLRTPKVFFLTKKGLDLLLEASWVTGASELKKVSTTEWTPVAWHRYRLIDAVIALRKALKDENSLKMESWTFEYWRDAKRRSSTRDELTYQGKSQVIVPDAVVLLEKKGSFTIPLMIEMDRATESLTSKKQEGRSIIEKLERYDAYLKSGAFQKKYDLDSEVPLICLWVIDGPFSRCESMASLKVPKTIQELTFFTTLKLIEERGFFENIWLRSGQPQLHCSFRS